MPQQTIEAIFNSLSEFQILVLAGCVGGLCVIFYEVVKRTFTWRSVLHIPIGIVIAFVDGQIDKSPGNGGLFVGGWLAGVAGISILEQFIGAKENNERVDRAAKVQVMSIKKQEQLATSLDEALAKLQNYKSLKKATTEVATLLSDLKKNLDKEA